MISESGQLGSALKGILIIKISIKTAGLALLLTACSNPGTEGPATQEKILPYSIYQHRLDNGLNVVTATIL